MDSKKCLKLIEIMENAYKLLQDKQTTREEVEKWRHLAIQNIRLLNKILRSQQLSNGEKIRIQTTISYLHTLTLKFNHQHHASIIGGAISESHTLKLKDRVQWKDLEKIFDNRIRTSVIVNLQHKDLLAFLTDANHMTTKRLKNVLRSEGSFKVNVVLACKFEIVKNSEVIRETKYFNTHNEAVLPSTNLKSWFQDNVIDPLVVKVEDFQERDSGWTLIEIINLMINFNRYLPLRGGFSTWMDLPDDIKRKKALIHIRNNDEYCFLWAVIAALHPANKNVNHTSSYPHFSSILKYDGIDFPISLSDISKFEDLNNLSINVYGIENISEIVPLYISQNRKSKEPTIYLLMIEHIVDLDDETNMFQHVNHFILIKNLSRLVSKQISKHNGRVLICDRCLSHFYCKKSYANHKQDCMNGEACKMILPNERENILKFQNHKYKETVPFAVYADLECMIEPTTSSGLQKHTPHSAAYYMHCAFDNSKSYFKLHRGPNCIDFFIEEMRKLAVNVEKIFKKSATYDTSHNQ